MVQTYQPLELSHLLQNLQDAQFSGTLCYRPSHQPGYRPSHQPGYRPSHQLSCQPNRPNITRATPAQATSARSASTSVLPPSGADHSAYFVVFRAGEIVYVDCERPSVARLSTLLVEEIDHALIKTAVQLAREQCENPDSFQEFLSRLVATRVMTWELVESALQQHAAELLYALAATPGTLTQMSQAVCDLNYGAVGRSGLSWPALIQAVEKGAIAQHTAMATQQNGGRSPRSPENQPARIQPTPERLTPTAPPTPPRQSTGALATAGQAIAQAAMPQTMASPAVTSQTAPVQSNPVSTGGGFRSSSLGQADGEAAERPTVLSVDDSPIAQKMVMRALAKSHHVLLANSALVALQMLNQNSQIRLVLLDVNIPGIGGIEFCRAVRSIPKFKTLPIIMLTANEDRVNKIKGQIAGSTLYLNKSMDEAKLLEVVRQYTHPAVVTGA